MFPRNQRIRKKFEIDRVFKQGKLIRTPLLYFRVLPNQQVFNRYLVIVSAKKLKKAVMRNRVRRQIIEAFRKELDPLFRGYDIVILANNVTSELEYPDLIATGKRLMEQLKISISV